MAHWARMHVNGSICTFPPRGNSCLRRWRGERDGKVPRSLSSSGCARRPPTPLHEFWADEVSLLDAAVVDAARIHGPRQITDVYLLALATRKGGRFVTFDGAVSHDAIPGAGRRTCRFVIAPYDMAHNIRALQQAGSIVVGGRPSAPLAPYRAVMRLQRPREPLRVHQR